MKSEEWFFLALLIGGLVVLSQIKPVVAVAPKQYGACAYRRCL